MRLNLRKHLLNNGTLKISSCVIGLMTWSILNETYRSHLTLTVPVCFYNVSQQYTISAPEQAYITISGTPAQVRNLDQKSIAVHIDAQKLVPGTNVIDMTSKNLLLPPQLSLVKYKPIQLTLNNAEL